MPFSWRYFSVHSSNRLIGHVSVDIRDSFLVKPIPENGGVRIDQFSASNLCFLSKSRNALIISVNCPVMMASNLYSVRFIR